MTQVENQLRFDSRLAASTTAPPPLGTGALVVALIVYAALFVILYPLAASSVAESAAHGNDPALLQFVGP